MEKFLLVGLGGALGSICRYGISRLVVTAPSAFPWNTLAVNLAGCFLIGLLMGWGGPEKGLQLGTRLLWVTGFCGGFTTFSTFSWEGLALLKAGNVGGFLFYAGLSLIVGFSLTVLGFWISGKLA